MINRIPRAGQGLGGGAPSESIAYIMGGYSTAYIGDNDSWDGTSWVGESGVSGRADGSAVSVDSVVNLCGGGNAGGKLQNHDKWDGSSWTTGGTIPAPSRGDLAASYVGSIGYIYCGYGTAYLRDCDGYDGASWSNYTDAPTPARRYLGAFSLTSGGHIIGGTDGTVFSDCDSWNETSWSAETSLLSARQGLSGGALNGVGYAFGGQWLSTCDSYNGSTWTNETDIPLPARAYMAASAFGGVAYLYYGYTSAANLQDCDGWDGTSWSNYTDGPTPTRRGCVASKL